MSLVDGVGIKYEEYFQKVQVIMLNYCLDGETDPTLVFANQATSSTASDSRYRDEDLHECRYATSQCKADWFNSTRFVKRTTRPYVRQFHITFTAQKCSKLLAKSYAGLFELHGFLSRVQRTLFENHQATAVFQKYCSMHG